MTADLSQPDFVTASVRIPAPRWRASRTSASARWGSATSGERLSSEAAARPSTNAVLRTLRQAAGVVSPAGGRAWSF